MNYQLLLNGKTEVLNLGVCLEIFFLNKRGKKLGCVLYTGAHYTRVNTVYENYMCELWLKKRIWKWSLQLRSSESLCLKCRKGLNFFRPYFHYYLSSVHNCEGHFHIPFVQPQFTHMIFIYLQSFINHPTGLIWYSFSLRICGKIKIIASTW